MKSLAEFAVRRSKEKVPLGTLLVAEDLILPQDLEFALDHQEHTSQLLGEILVRIGALNYNDLDKILKLQSGVKAH